MQAPPDRVIHDALHAARQSPCAKSHRGVVVFGPYHGATESDVIHLAYGSGWNGPPPGFACDGSAACRASCRHLCEHAEARAVRAAMDCAQFKPLELVHVKADAAGQLVAGSGPSCAPCSRLILDSGIIAGVWLYEAMPESWCPHRDEPRTECMFCQGIDCIANGGKCDASDIGPCPHDVLQRHGTLPIVEARWRRYTADQFHELSLRASGLPVIRAAPVNASGSSR